MIASLSLVVLLITTAIAQDALGWGPCQEEGETCRNNGNNKNCCNNLACELQGLTYKCTRSGNNCISEGGKCGGIGRCCSNLQCRQNGLKRTCERTGNNNCVREGGNCGGVGRCCNNLQCRQDGFKRTCERTSNNNCLQVNARCDNTDITQRCCNNMRCQSRPGSFAKYCMY